MCAELVAAWPGSAVVEEYTEDYDDSGGGEESDGEDDGRWDSGCRRVAVKVRQKQNRAVLFTAAVPYAAVRATYECKVRQGRSSRADPNRSIIIIGVYRFFQLISMCIDFIILFLNNLFRYTKR